MDRTGRRYVVIELNGKTVEVPVAKCNNPKMVKALETMQVTEHINIKPILFNTPSYA